ncbi:MAG: ABC transporter ATP-binding protein, partial [Panacibacter sp.]
ISFDVKQGEVLGIIGKNGAGKSTLLKILARTTAPTKGEVKIKGRVASLLEVGTGFHNELSGRENIYLNGSILGMKKKEIDSHFEEIVEFSGVAKFIDTPVKRYSSGMYTRLAFAVAAHMNPEILIVDEVLAVGDASFQQKCLGKMKEVSRQQGKTILFVSHNMAAIQNLCNRAVSLHQGQVSEIGAPETVVNNYLKKEKALELEQAFESIEAAPGNDAIRVKKVKLLPDFLPGQQVIDIRTPLKLSFEFWHLDKAPGSLIAGIHLFSITGEFIFDICSEGIFNSNGLLEGHCTIPGNFLNDGSYFISLVFVKNTTQRLYYHEACLQFDVEDYRKDTAWFGKWHGVVRPGFPVSLRIQE